MFYVRDDVLDTDCQVSLTDVMLLDEQAEPLPVQTDGGVLHVEGGIPGDVDRDGQVTGTDSLRLKQYLVGMIVLEDTANADMNRDGRIDAQDVLLLEQLLAGKTK